MESYLIQRGIIRNAESKKGIDSIVSFDYMGASEYEWGALPESLERLRLDINNYTYLDVPIKEKVITVFCKDNQKSDVKTYLNVLSNSKMRTKCGHKFDNCVNPSEYEKEWQSKHPLEINFWWDIENDLMFWVKDLVFEKVFKSLIPTKPNK